MKKDWRLGLAIGASTGLLATPAVGLHKALPGLLFAACFLPWPVTAWRKVAGALLSTGVWWLCYHGAAESGQGLADTVLAQSLFWGRWGGLGGFLLGLGLLLLGFPGLRRPLVLPALGLAGAMLAQVFWAAGDSDAEFYAAFMLWQGGMAALLTYLITDPARR